MGSPRRVSEIETVSIIPPVISYNPREKIEAEHIPVHEVLKHLIVNQKVEWAEHVNTTHIHKSSLPTPSHPLSIEWSPSAMYFEIDERKVSQKLRIWNICSRSIYITCCGLWGGAARLGARWRCFPRTKYVLAPGLAANILIEATPLAYSLVPSAQLALQLAAAHKRDCVVGYFVVPIIIKFQQYVKPCQEEASKNNSVTVT